MTAEKKDLLKSFFTWRSAIASKEGPTEATTRHILLTLSLHMNEKGGSCFPSINLLTEETGRSKKTVINHINLAVKEGWLEKKVRGISGQGWKSHEYQAVIPKGKGGVVTTPRYEEGGVIEGKKVVSSLHLSTSKSTLIMQPKKPAADNVKKSINKSLSGHAWFTRWWCFVSESVTGKKYPYKRKDAGQVKQLLKLVGGLENLISRACVYISWPAEKRFPKGSLTIGGLLYQIAEVSDIDDDLYNRFAANGYLPDDSGSEQIILKEFQPWKENNVTATAS